MSEVAIRPWNVKGWLGFNHVRAIPSEQSVLEKDERYKGQTCEKIFSWDEAWIPSNPKLDRMHLRSALKPMNDWRCKLDFGIFSHAAVKAFKRFWKEIFAILIGVCRHEHMNRGKRIVSDRQTDRQTGRQADRQTYQKIGLDWTKSN